MKKFIFQIIQPDRGKFLASRVFDYFITMLILLSVASVYAVTFDLPPEIKRPIACFEDFVAIQEQEDQFKYCSYCGKRIRA